MEHLINRELTEPMKQANQANSQKSTGPKTERGKCNSRGNAWCHGIFGRGELCPWAEELDEDAEDYQRFHHRFQEAFQVRDEVERLLAADMARTQWRLERVLHAESACLAHRRRRLANDQRRALAGEGMGMRAAFEQMVSEQAGYGALPESAGKYELILLLLYSVRVDVETEGYGGTSAQCLELIYGQQPGVAKKAFLLEHQGLQAQADRSDAVQEHLRRQFLDN